MARANLRLYRGPETEPAGGIAEDDEPQPATGRQTIPFAMSQPEVRRTVTLALSEVVPALADALASRRAWIHDFDEDQITLSADFYEVLLAYQRLRRPSA